MNKPRWKILEEAEYAYLDTINLKPLLCKNIHKHIFELMDLIRDTYNEDYKNKNTVGDNRAHSGKGNGKSKDRPNCTGSKTHQQQRISLQRQTIVHIRRTTGEKMGMVAAQQNRTQEGRQDHARP